MLADWDNRSDLPEMVRDYAYREQPALQEYDWAREQRHERQIPIEIVNSILNDLRDCDDAPLPN